MNAALNIFWIFVALLIIGVNFAYGYFKGWVKPLIKIINFSIAVVASYFLVNVLFSMVSSVFTGMQSLFIDWLNGVEGFSQTVSTSSLTEEACREYASMAGLPSFFFPWAYPAIEGAISGRSSITLSAAIGPGLWMAASKIIVWLVLFIVLRIVIGLLVTFILFIVDVSVRTETVHGVVHHLVSGGVGLIYALVVIFSFNMFLHIYSDIGALNVYVNIETALGVNNDDQGSFPGWLYNTTEGIYDAIFNGGSQVIKPESSSSSGSSNSSSGDSSQIYFVPIESFELIPSC